MIVICEECGVLFDDEFRDTGCPHGTFAANDGQNNFAHHPESFISDGQHLSKVTPTSWLSEVNKQVRYKFVAYMKSGDVQLWTQDFRHAGSANAEFEDRNIAKVFAIAPEHQHLTGIATLANLYVYEPE